MEPDSGTALNQPTDKPKRSILIVDDVPAVRESLRWLFEDQPDLQVIGEAGDGMQAIQRCIELSPQVVVLDIEMPQLDGLAAARRLKVLPSPPHVVFLSVHDDDATRALARDAGGDGFAAKGEGWSTLLAQVRAVVKNA